MEGQQKLCVLFVDDEAAVLNLLRASLADMRDQWEMSFAPSAAKGLEGMARTQFDVVVSDLNMPAMNGADFLKEVRKRSPSSARIIYSRASDQWSILECVGLIHQFLPKPCPVELLKATVQRAAMVGSLASNWDIREKISKMERLPSLPTLYVELVRQLQSVETEIADIARTVSVDLGMTAQILKIVNSAFFGLPQPTSSVADAISFLGFETVKHLVLAVGIFSQFESRKLGGISLETLWQHSAQTSQAAKLIAKSATAKRELVEDAFAAGLLHDVGKVVLASHYPEQYQEIGRNAQAKSVEWLVEEREVFGFDHADVGGYLLGLWGLPPAVVEAVAFHHFPIKSERTDFTALTAVHAANVLVQTRRAFHGGIIPPQIDLLYLAKIGQADAVGGWRGQLEETDSLLIFPTIFGGRSAADHADDTVPEKKLTILSQVNTKDPAAVESEVQAAGVGMFPHGDQAFVSKAFLWARTCFSGNYRGYLPIDARYHDFEHTLQGTLCMMRLLHGRHVAKAQPDLTQKMFELGLLAILLHDTGYLKKREDTEGTGAKYTLIHVNRSAEFAAQLLGEKGFGPKDILAVQNMIRCTGVNVYLPAIRFQSDLERTVGYALATADLLGQMAAPDYVDKLPILYEEFAESERFNAGNQTPRAVFSSAQDLLQKTPAFWGKFVLPRVQNEFQGLYGYLSQPYPDGPNDYLEAIEANLERVQRTLSGAPA